MKGAAKHSGASNDALRSVLRSPSRMLAAQLGVTVWAQWALQVMWGMLHRRPDCTTQREVPTKQCQACTNRQPPSEQTVRCRQRLTCGVKPQVVGAAEQQVGGGCGVPIDEEGVVNQVGITEQRATTRRLPCAALLLRVAACAVAACPWVGRGRARAAIKLPQGRNWVEAGAAVGTAAGTAGIGGDFPALCCVPAAGPLKGGGQLELGTPATPLAILWGVDRGKVTQKLNSRQHQSRSCWTVVQPSLAPSAHIRVPVAVQDRQQRAHVAAAPAARLRSRPSTLRHGQHAPPGHTTPTPTYGLHRCRQVVIQLLI